LDISFPTGVAVMAIPYDVNQGAQPLIGIGLRSSKISLRFGKLGESFFVLFLMLFVMYLQINQVVYLATVIPQLMTRPKSRPDD